MKVETFISIGTKGTSLPRLTRLDPPLAVGVNVLRWAGRDKVPEAEKAHGWVSENGKPFELFPLDRAIREGRAQHFLRVTWVGRADGSSHTGEAFFPDWWKPGDPQPPLVAARSASWTPGCVEKTLIRDGRNRESVARFDLDTLPAAEKSPGPAPESAAIAENWTDEEFRGAVSAYVEMLTHEQAGAQYNKAEHIRVIRAGVLSNRSIPAIEFRMADISTALAEAKLP